MEEDLEQPNIISLSHHCQDTGSRILSIFANEQLSQLPCQPIGIGSQPWKYERVSGHKREAEENVVEDGGYWVPRFALFPWSWTDPLSSRLWGYFSSDHCWEFHLQLQSPLCLWQWLMHHLPCSVKLACSWYDPLQICRQLTQDKSTQDMQGKDGQMSRVRSQWWYNRKGIFYVYLSKI